MVFSLFLFFFSFFFFLLFYVCNSTHCKKLEIYIAIRIAYEWFFSTRTENAKCEMRIVCDELMFHAAHRGKMYEIERSETNEEMRYSNWRPNVMERML